MPALRSSWPWILTFTAAISCGDKSDDDDDDRWEGQNAGECDDGADNDGDGAYDCNDSDCAGAPDCEEADADTDADTDTDTDTDNDGDGWASGDDCDDGNGEVHPDADEVCDELDNDCDGAIDTEDESLVGATWYTTDADGDGAGVDPVQTCEPEDGWTQSADSDDDNAWVFPGATERCDGIQNDSDTSWTSSDEDDLAGTAWFVASDGTETDWTGTLAGAVEITQSGTLWVCPGQWTTWLEVSASDVVVRGAGESSILDADDNARVIAVQADDVTIRDLSLLNGDTNDESYGGGVYVQGYNGTILQDLLLQLNEGQRGGGLYAGDANLTLTRVVFESNVATELGGGAFFSSSTATVDSCRFDSNITYDSGGGVMLYSGADVTFTDTEFETNEAPYGAGLNSMQSRLSLDRVSFDGHSGNNGAGLRLIGWTRAEITDSTFANNVVTSTGGGIYLDDTTSTLELTVTSTDFSDNRPSDGHFKDVGDYTWGSSASFTCDDDGCY